MGGGRQVALSPPTSKNENIAAYLRAQCDQSDLPASASSSGCCLTCSPYTCRTQRRETRWRHISEYVTTTRLNTGPQAGHPRARLRWPSLSDSIIIVGHKYMLSYGRCVGLLHYAIMYSTGREHFDLFSSTSGVISKTKKGPK